MIIKMGKVKKKVTFELYTANFSKPSKSFLVENSEIFDEKMESTDIMIRVENLAILEIILYAPTSSVDLK